MSPLAGKPYLTLRIEAADCRHDVQVNGISLSLEPRGRPVQVDWPLNPYLRAGRNEIRIVQYPWPASGDWPAPGRIGNNARVSATVLVRTSGEDPATDLPAWRLSCEGGANVLGSTPPGRLASASGFAPDDEGDVVIDAVSLEPVPGRPGALMAALGFSLPLPFPEWAFLRAEPTRPTLQMTEEEFDAVTRALFDGVQGLWRGLSEGRIDEVVAACAERSTELDLAFHRGPGDTAAQLTSSLRDALYSGEWNLEDLSFDHSQLVVHPGGQLATLVDPATRDSILQFQSSDGSTTMGYDLLFRREGSGWVIAR